jgi:primosomal protein N' (replication factor Y)
MVNAMVKFIIQVHVLSPIKNSFTFLSDAVEVGARVIVPFGKNNNKRMAIVSSVQVYYQTNRKIKHVIAILDKQSLWNEGVSKLLAFASNYYFAFQGMVYAASLPKLIKEGGQTGEVTRQWISTTVKANSKAEIEVLKRAPKQKIFIESLFASPMLKIEAKQHGGSPAILTALKNRGLIQEIELPLPSLDRLWSAKLDKFHPLNQEQNEAIKVISASREKPVLLFGVTGSGKSEIYLNLIAKYMAAGMQSLVLVPEIGLTPQMIDYFKSRFNCPIAVLHSGLTDKQRSDNWRSAKAGQVSIVIGTRSSIFVPMMNLGIIIVDEEHDTSFKQDIAFSYSGKDMALMRAKYEQVPIVLGSATPSIESWSQTKANRYSLATLNKRASLNAELPTVSLMNVKDKKMYAGLSTESLSLISKHTNKGGQVLVYIGRRGYAPVQQCPDCGWVKKCKPCDKPFVFHKETGRLKCHVCHSSAQFPNECPVCYSKELTQHGIGTERVEEMLEQQFPHLRVSRADSDSTRKKGSLEKIIKDFEDKKTQILIGTQLLTKGHDFKNISLVIILQSDYALISEDFRAKEHLTQLVHQVAGRSGRSALKGEVYLQTEHYDDEFMNMLVRKPYGEIADNILALRKGNFPPFKPLAVLHVSDFRKDKCKVVLENIKNSMKQNQRHNVVFGAITSASIAKKQGKFDLILPIYGNTKMDLHRTIEESIDNIRSISKKTSFQIDIDPQKVS